MKNFLKLLGAIVALSIAACAQQGVYSSTSFPGYHAGQGTSGVYYVCLPATSQTACIAGTVVAVTSDAAGASAISQTTGIPLPGNGQIMFYAAPGTYYLLFVYSAPKFPNQQLTITVASDSATNVGLNDGYFIVPPGACAWASSGGTVTPATANGILAVGASQVPVNQIATTTGTETATLTCLGSIPSRLTAGKGIVIQNVVLFYGNSTGTLASMGTPTLGTITLPTPGTSETPSTVTPVTAGGTLTVTPAVASANLTALTAGAFYTEKIALATPLAVQTDLTDIVLTQAFVGPGSASLTLYTGGLIVHYSISPI